MQGSQLIIMAPNSIPGGGLNVIALVSGGKDSFFSALHCLENGHRLVALANLEPPRPSHHYAGPGRNPSVPASASVGTIGTGGQGSDLAPPPGPVREADVAGERQGASDSGANITTTIYEQDPSDSGSPAETDLNSFMYQTVGHQVIPLYAEATGIPLYRQTIIGGALHSGRDYSTAAVSGVQASNQDEDETESMVPLLRAIKAKHPEANALNAGAILSTYQRTRVESVALRLGLTPLAYLWKYPVLPPPLGVSKDEAQLLFDMATAGLEARIIKVASGGLDESLLWEKVASAKGIMWLKKAMGRFGSAGVDTGAVIGEGGEFETLVVDGPRRLFKRRIVVPENARSMVREGGGTAWLSFGTATLEEKTEVEEEEQGQVRRPDLLDARFAAVLQTLRAEGTEETNEAKDDSFIGAFGGRRNDELSLTLQQKSSVETWAFTRSQNSPPTSTSTIHEETTSLINHIREELAQRGLTPSSILSTIIILRSMADFPAINSVYGSLFSDPNPPSRVTISCGDLLPLSSGNIAIYLTLSSTSDNGKNRRDGLHVQSRSYWAPANIGPYSQAITFPTALLAPTEDSPSIPTLQNRNGGRRVVHIAGQIPLVPSSMEFLPMDAPDGGMEMQLVLSLQHLWRIGVEMGVQWWTSAVVFFPHRPDSSLSAKEKALLGWRTWKEAHARKVGGGDDEDEDEDGPDLWDRKFNPKYMSYADEAPGNKGGPELPDYSLFGEDVRVRSKKPLLPYFFAVEVDELPRSAEAEWHAHAGLSGLVSGADSLSMSTWRGSYGDTTTDADGQQLSQQWCEVNHCILTSTDRVDDDEDDIKEEVSACLHSVIAIESLSQDAIAQTKATLLQVLFQARKAFYASLDKTTNTSVILPEEISKPYLVYVDTDEFSAEDIAAAIKGDDGLAIVPCKNIYGAGSSHGGKPSRLRVVVLYRHLLSSSP